MHYTSDGHLYAVVREPVNKRASYAPRPDDVTRNRQESHMSGENDSAQIETSSDRRSRNGDAWTTTEEVKRLGRRNCLDRGTAAGRSPGTLPESEATSINSRETIAATSPRATGGIPCPTTKRKKNWGGDVAPPNGKKAPGANYPGKTLQELGTG